MRRPGAATVLLALTTACGGGSASAPGSISTPVPGGRPLIVMTLNIHQGVDENGHSNLESVANVIARIQPDLVGLQEVLRNHPSYDCQDQPALIGDALVRATGRTWSKVYVEEWFTSDRTCVQSGRGTDAESEGLAFFAPDQIGSVASTKLWNGRIGLAATTGGSGGLPVIVTHLASGSGSAATDRQRQVSQLAPWAATQGASRILLGDFNAAAGSPDLQPISDTMHDAWTDAMMAGTAMGVLSGDTRVRGGSIDHVFFTSDARLTLDSAEVVDTVALVGTQVSDHRPVVARFRVH